MLDAGCVQRKRHREAYLPGGESGGAGDGGFGGDAGGSFGGSGLKVYVRKSVCTAPVAVTSMEPLDSRPSSLAPMTSSGP